MARHPPRQAPRRGGGPTRTTAASPSRCAVVPAARPGRSVSTAFRPLTRGSAWGGMTPGEWIALRHAEAVRRRQVLLTAWGDAVTHPVCPHRSGLCFGRIAPAVLRAWRGSTFSGALVLTSLRVFMDYEHVPLSVGVAFTPPGTPPHTTPVHPAKYAGALMTRCAANRKHGTLVGVHVYRGQPSMGHQPDMAGRTRLRQPSGRATGGSGLTHRRCGTRGTGRRKRPRRRAWT